MKKIIASVFLFLFILGAGSLCYAEAMDIEGVVDSFQKATDLQKNQILEENSGRAISCGGIVNNVGEYDFFDTVNDIRGSYYRLTTEQQKTKNNTPYQLVFLFQDKESAKDIDKGQSVQKDGKIIRIIDERLQVSVWIFCGELTDKDKGLFKQN